MRVPKCVPIGWLVQKNMLKINAMDEFQASASDPQPFSYRRPAPPLILLWVIMALLHLFTNRRAKQIRIDADKSTRQLIDKTG